MDVAQSASLPSTSVELTISCSNLVDADVFSKSDPMCVIFTQEYGMDNWKEYGRTEVIWNNLNPSFVTKINIDYYFETRQHLKFAVYDVDSNTPDLTKHDFLGFMTCTLGEIVSAGLLKRNLNGPKKNSGTMTVKAEELANLKDNVTLHFSGTHLERKNTFFGKSDPFLEFYKANETGSWTICHKTEQIMSTLEPQWKPFTIPVRAFCNGDYDRTIRIICYDWERSGSHQLIGECTTNLRDLCSNSSNGRTFELINPKKKLEKKSYVNSGKLMLRSCIVQPTYSFVDYLSSGSVQIQCTFAIDFTASNLDQRNPDSLHYYNPYSPNQYEQAIRAVGEILQDYDSDKWFPALGFGAKIPPNYAVSHEFFLNFAQNPHCHLVEGVLAAYRNAVSCVQLYGPTNFAPVINHVARCARMSPIGTSYFVLLIVTDGVITDLEQTKEAVVCASSLPLSIIIIGVGSADFGAMEELDGDTVRVSCRGVMAERDIVQFVPYLEVARQRPGEDPLMTRVRLAREVLAEIPEQFLSYMKKHNIKPLNRGNAAPPGGVPPPPYSEQMQTRPPPPSY